MREIACVIFRDGTGRILLQQRGTRARREQSYWHLFGGHIDEGESPEKAAVREIAEELGIQIAEGSLQPFYEGVVRRADGEEEHLTLFAAEYLPEYRITLGEGRGYGFFLWSEAEYLTMLPDIKEVVKQYCVRYGQVHS